MPEPAPDSIALRWQWVACPLCSADQPCLLVTDVVHRAGERYEFRIVRCSRCGMIYTNPRGYSQVLQPEPGGAARTDAAVANAPIYARGLARLAHFGLSRGGRVLDVGCARGDFLALASQRGYQVVGVELNPRLAAVAAQRGFEILVGDLRSLSIHQAFDAVTLWDVLEHVEAPIELLGACHRALGPGGLLLVHTGNAHFQIPKARLLRRLRPRGGPYLIPYQHLLHFDPGTLALALCRADFQVLEVAFAGTLCYRSRGKRWIMGAWNGLAALVHRAGGPLWTNTMAAIGRRSAGH